MIVVMFVNGSISLAREGRGMIVVGKHAGNNHSRRVDGWKVTTGGVVLPCDRWVRGIRGVLAFRRVDRITMVYECHEEGGLSLLAR